MATDANWSLSVPTRHVDSDGNAIVVASVTDETTGETGTVTVTLTPARELQVLAATLKLSGYQAWSTD